MTNNRQRLNMLGLVCADLNAKVAWKPTFGPAKNSYAHNLLHGRFDQRSADAHTMMFLSVWYPLETTVHDNRTELIDLTCQEIMRLRRLT